MSERPVEKLDPDGAPIPAGSPRPLAATATGVNQGRVWVAEGLESALGDPRWWGAAAWVQGRPVPPGSVARVPDDASVAADLAWGPVEDVLSLCLRTATPDGSRPLTARDQARTRVDALAAVRAGCTPVALAVVEPPAVVEPLAGAAPGPVSGSRPRMAPGATPRRLALVAVIGVPCPRARPRWPLWAGLGIAASGIAVYWAWSGIAA